jgi:hypothetical protein
MGTAPDRDEQPPERLGVREIRHPDGTQEHCVVPSQLIQAVHRHHASVSVEILGPPIQLYELQADGMDRCDTRQALNRRRHDLLPNSISCNHRYPMCGHGSSSPFVGLWFRPPGGRSRNQNMGLALTVAVVEVSASFTSAGAPRREGRVQREPSSWPSDRVSLGDYSSLHG